MNKAVLLPLSRRPARGGGKWTDRAIEVYERLVNQECWAGTRHELAMRHMNRVDAVSALGLQPRRGVVLYDRAIQIYERLVNREARWNWPMSWPGAT